MCEKREGSDDRDDSPGGVYDLLHRPGGVLLQREASILMDPSTGAWVLLVMAVVMITVAITANK